MELLADLHIELLYRLDNPVHLAKRKPICLARLHAGPSQYHNHLLHLPEPMLGSAVRVNIEIAVLPPPVDNLLGIGPAVGHGQAPEGNLVQDHGH